MTDKNILLKEDEYKKLSNFFSVFSDPTRLKIIVFLLNSSFPCCVTKIATSLSMNQPAVSQQMRVLRSAGLVKAFREGKFVRYTIADKHVYDVLHIGILHIASFSVKED